VNLKNGSYGLFEIKLVGNDAMSDECKEINNFDGDLIPISSKINMFRNFYKICVKLPIIR